MKNRQKQPSRTLSSYEENVLLPILIKGLAAKKGKMNAVTNKEIVHAVRQHGVRINRQSVVVLISHIRKNDLIVGLMAAANGYYVGSSEQDLIDYEMRLKNRETELRKLRMNIKRQRSAAFMKREQRHAHIF